ncbi:MAG TPA: hypothetical protein VFW98_10500 [Gemmatimonadaceae bacterium]|nr:hypothetical protein [Gemmatimonadaceae bacterium]
MLAASICLIAACRSDTAPVSVLGTYRLTSIDGRAMPAALDSERVVLDGIIALRVDGLYQYIAHFGGVPPSDRRDTLPIGDKYASGRYTLDRSTLRLERFRMVKMHPPSLANSGDSLVAIEGTLSHHTIQMPVRDGEQWTFTK